ncbi:MAG: leucine-rich repeat protein [Oscillospiraceae bacterium]
MCRPSACRPRWRKSKNRRSCSAHNLTKITLPDGLETIGDEAFDGCRFKKAIVLPASIKSIGKKAFYGYSIMEAVRSARISSAQRPRLSGR